MFKFNPLPPVPVGISAEIMISAAGSKEHTLVKSTEVQIGLREQIRAGEAPRD